MLSFATLASLAQRGDITDARTSHVPGLLRRYVNHLAIWCHKIDDMSYENSSLLETRAIALVGMQKGAVRLGDPVIVCGAGPTGSVTLLCCQEVGATPVLICDIDERRLKFVMSLVPRVRTYHERIGPIAEDSANYMIDKVGGIRPAIVMECTGVESSINAAIWSAKFGGEVFIIGVGKNERKIPLMRLSTLGD